MSIDPIEYEALRYALECLDRFIESNDHKSMVYMATKLEMDIQGLNNPEHRLQKYKENYVTARAMLSKAQESVATVLAQFQDDAAYEDFETKPN